LERTKGVLKGKKKAVDSLVQNLIERETLSRAEFEEILEKNQ
jgi:ATP-dependent Zn protease